MDENQKAGAAATAGKQPRHEQLKSMLNNLRSVTDHINELNLKVGVKPKAQPAPPPVATPVMSAPTKPVDDLISVLDMLPEAVASEVARIQRAIYDLEDNLL